MKKMNCFLTTLFVFVTTLAVQIASAQSMYGYGAYGGMNQCPYGMEAGAGSSDIADDIQEINDGISSKKEEMADALKDAREAKRDFEAGRNSVTRYGLNADSVSFLEKHISGQNKCSAYNNLICPPDEGGACIAIAPKDCRSADKVAVATDGTATDSVVESKDGSPLTKAGWKCGVNSASEFIGWDKVCDQGQAGTVKAPAACELGKPVDSSKTYGKYDKVKCTEGLDKWQKSYKEWKNKTELAASLKAEIALAKSEIKKLKKDYKNDQREEQREARREATEGGCATCALAGNGYQPQQRRASTGDIIANVALAGMSMYAGYKSNEINSNNDAKLGFQSKSYPTLGYGWPYFMAALGGATGGGGGFYGGVGGGVGSGAFGCGGSGGGGSGGGGAFGYPNGMYGSPMGGGMYMPGMGPWGMAGPWGSGNGGMGGGMGYPMGGMMGAMMNGGGMMGYPMGGGAMMNGGGMGYPMGGMMGAMMNGGGMMGYPMGGGAMMNGGGMMGYPMGGGAMMNGGGMMGYPMGGGAMMNGGGMMGYPMGGGAMMNGGAMMGGAMMGGNMMGGNMMGGNMMGGAMMGGNMMGGAQDGGAAQMQMYQQQMQMQMQMQQQQMDMQRRMQESQIAKTRALSGLQSELQTLMYRIQQVQYGSSGTSGFLGADFSGQGSIQYQQQGYPQPTNTQQNPSGPSQR